MKTVCAFAKGTAVIDTKRDKTRIHACRSQDAWGIAAQGFMMGVGAGGGLGRPRYGLTILFRDLVIFFKDLLSNQDIIHPLGRIEVRRQNGEERCFSAFSIPPYRSAA